MSEEETESDQPWASLVGTTFAGSALEDASRLMRVVV